MHWININEPSRSQQQEVKLDFVSIGKLSGVSLPISLLLERHSLELQLLPSVSSDVLPPLLFFFWQNTLLCLFVSMYMIDSSYQPGPYGCPTLFWFQFLSWYSDSRERECGCYLILAQVVMASRRQPSDVMYLIIISAWGRAYGKLGQCVSYSE